MHALLLNPPHTAIGSRIPDDHLPPLGLLALGGPLIDAGHQVELLDADRTDLSIEAILEQLHQRRPQALLLGHSGSTSAHPTIERIAREARRILPDLHILVGGPFPSYHWREVLQACPEIDLVVRGEGEQTVARALHALERGLPLASIPGLAFHGPEGPESTASAPVITDLDPHRIGWELIDHADYSYYGGRRAVVLQFSRGCPHTCTYCGQFDFWIRWRHRDPVRFAAEIARLYREEGVELINLADENPTASRRHWKAFLEALIAEDVPVALVGSTRADDIVRDADILHLYRQAGVVRFLLGTESTDEETLRKVNKGASTTTDREAIRLLREHGILSMATWVVGFQQETPETLLRGLRQLLAYDPDQIQTLFVTPHRWTPFFDEVAEHRVIQTDPRKWDYKHQVLACEALSPAQLFALVKAIEVLVQARPAALRRLLFPASRESGRGMRWYTRMGRRVWFHEVAEALAGWGHTRTGPTLRELWGSPSARRVRRRVYSA